MLSYEVEKRGGIGEIKELVNQHNIAKCNILIF